MNSFGSFRFPDDISREVKSQEEKWAAADAALRRVIREEIRDTLRRMLDSSDQAVTVAEPGGTADTALSLFGLLLREEAVRLAAGIADGEKSGT